MPAPIQGITPPNKLEVLDRDKLVENWKTFKQMWQNYAVITNMRAQTEEYRIALFLHCIGPDALRIYNGFDFATEEEQKSLENVIQKFDQYAIGELNETYERFQFNDRNQKPDHETDESDVEIVSGVSELCDSIHAVQQCGFLKEIYVEMLIDEKSVTFQVDSGSSINIIPEKYAGEQPIIPTQRRLRMWNGAEMNPVGTTRLIIRNPKDRKKYSLEFIVVKESLTPLIGARAAQHMQLITVNADKFVTASNVKSVKETSEVKRLTTVEQLLEEYSDVLNRQLGTLPGKVHLEVDKDAKPVITPVRRVPTALTAKLKAELDKELNKALKRETYHELPILDEILPELAQAKVFSTVDLRSGFWHCVLDEESSILTTFATPYGRYRWRRLPFGLNVSSEIFQRNINQALEGLEGLLDITDDILIYGVGSTDDQANADHDQKLRSLLQRCRERGIALNKDKVKLRRKEVTFMGHVFTSNGLKIDPDKVKAIVNMPKPEDIQGVQRLNGFVNYLAKFLPKLSDVMLPIRELTRKDVEWQWSEKQEKAFAEVKRAVTEAPVLRYYDPKKDLEIQCDASQSGLGATLMQEGKPIAYASRALSECETRYAQIEKEMLALVYSLEKFHQYTFGRLVKVQSDHKPLEAILKKPLSRAPQRLQGMMMRLQRYVVEVHYECGTNMLIADMLSRAYLTEPDFKGQAEFEQINMAKFLPITDQRLEEIRQETNRDDTLQVLSAVILQGWPEAKADVPSEATTYFSIRDELTVQDGIILRGDRVIIPSSLRQSLKEKIHSSHMGIESCLRRARECVYWPGMSADIRQLIETCETCRKFEVSQPKESLMPHEVPSRPWQRVGVDLFELNNKDYLVCVDYYSNFWEVDRLRDTKANTVILKMKSHFSRYGCPDVVISDNGPQFSCREFAKFAHDWEFEHNTSSPGNSKANGKAESAVKTAKNLMKKSLEAGTDLYTAILDYRNTPTQGLETSPAQRLMNRRTKTLLPTTKTLLQPRVYYADKEQSQLKQRQERQRAIYDKNARDLPPLCEGDTVRMKPFRPGERMWRKAIVTEMLDDRSYYVESQDGGTYRRNRQHLN
ncbi:hypothetical protein QZH41_016289 [Actinostola sp. cb2023]|nr:hypothetical protein QZH41_016289 [Actinostola sp. cb2023]